MRPVARVILVLVVVLVAAFLLFGYWTGEHATSTTAGSAPTPVGTTGAIDTEKARERGAELGEKAATAAAKVGEAAATAAAEVKETAAETALTAKIKSKMALDDSVEALAIGVTTSGSTVTLTGKVRSAAEHNRAMTLARETDGVTEVIDHLQLR